MKVLLINGSPHPKGCTYTALENVAIGLHEFGIETEMIQVGHLDIRGCIACGSCGKNGKCVFDDAVNEVAKKFEEADGIVVGSPVYYAGPNGTLKSFLDRLFYSTHFSKTMKVGAAVVSCRRGGASSTFDVLNKYFSISQMPIATSRYWNSVHGNTAEEVKQDLEGLFTMRTLGRNMAFLLEATQKQKEATGLPEMEPRVATNFIRK